MQPRPEWHQLFRNSEYRLAFALLSPLCRPGIRALTWKCKEKLNSKQFQMSRKRRGVLFRLGITFLCYLICAVKRLRQRRKEKGNFFESLISPLIFLSHQSFFAEIISHASVNQDATKLTNWLTMKHASLKFAKNKRRFFCECKKSA